MKERPSFAPPSASDSHESAKPVMQSDRVSDQAVRGGYAEWQREVGNVLRLRKEALDGIARLERIRKQGAGMSSEQSGWVYALLRERPEVLSEQARLDLAQALQSKDLARTIVLEYLGNIKELAAYERTLYEERGMPSDKIDALMAARQEHLNVLMKEWDVQ